MPGRERYTAKIVCSVCGQAGIAKFSEVENPIFNNGHLDLRAEWLGEGFRFDAQGKLKIACARCGSVNVTKEEGRQEGAAVPSRTEKPALLNHTQQIRESLKILQDRLLQRVEAADEPELRAILQASASVIGGLEKLFKNYDEREEKDIRSAP